MKCFSNLLITLVIDVFCFLRNASSILCYDCNSAFDPRCGEEFDSFSLGIVNCSLRDPLEHIPDAEPTLCRSIKMEIYGKVRVVRQCGYIEEENTEHSCRRQASSGDLFVTYCSCKTDLCNNAPAHGTTFLFVLVLAFMGIMLRF